MTVAALFVDTKGCYSGLDGVEMWDEAMDARKYPGPHPVVAHPPCSRWCRLAGLVEARWGHKRGDDGGCFAAALAAVRRWGGVLEHPAHTDAFRAYGLGRPPARGGWQGEICGGWTCHIEQVNYGHPAKKATWLYAFGTALPQLRWGYQPDTTPSATVSWCGNKLARIGDLPSNGDTDWASRRRLSKREASATPVEFRDTLLDMARSVRRAGVPARGPGGSL